jgi:hypothetical protein
MVNIGFVINLQYLDSGVYPMPLIKDKQQIIKVKDINPYLDVPTILLNA